MKRIHNVGRIDRIIRVSISAVLIALYFAHLFDEKTSNILLSVAIVLAFTSLNRCCPIYAILGMGTCKTVIESDSDTKIETKKMDL